MSQNLDQTGERPTAKNEFIWTTGFDEEDQRIADESWFAMLKADRENDAAVQTIGKVLGVKNPTVLRE